MSTRGYFCSAVVEPQTKPTNTGNVECPIFLVLYAMLWNNSVSWADLSTSRHTFSFNKTNISFENYVSWTEKNRIYFEARYMYIKQICKEWCNARFSTSILSLHQRQRIFRDCEINSNDVFIFQVYELSIFFGRSYRPKKTCGRKHYKKKLSRLLNLSFD
jgi:hypothetical protein